MFGWVTVGVPSMDFETDEVPISAFETLIGTTEVEEATAGTCI